MVVCGHQAGHPLDYMMMMMTRRVKQNMMTITNMSMGTPLTCIVFHLWPATSVLSAVAPLSVVTKYLSPFPLGLHGYAEQHNIDGTVNFLDHIHFFNQYTSKNSV